MGGGASKGAKPKAAPRPAGGAMEGLNDPLYNGTPAPDEQESDQPQQVIQKKYAVAAAPASAPAAPTEEFAADTVASDVEAPTANAGNAGVTLSFSSPGGGGRTIKQQSTAGALVDSAGSLRPSDGQSLMSRVDLGALHSELSGLAQVSEAQFAAALRKLLVGAEAPPAEVVTALFRAFDADGSGEVDEKELIAGCQALCSGDESTKLRLAFTCFDKDGDGHLTPDELKELLRGTIQPAVAQLHAAIDFASFGADGDEPDLDAIKEEAGGAAELKTASEAGHVQVELQTKAGVATISVPAAALSGEGGLESSALSLDAFLAALVSGAIDKYDADKNGMIEIDEFVHFARENPFLSAWFGHLTEQNARSSSWKDDFVVG